MAQGDGGQGVGPAGDHHDATGVIAGEGGGDHLLGRLEEAAGGLGHHLGGAVGLSELSAGEAGTDGGDDKALGAVLGVERLAEADHQALGARIEGVACDAGREAGQGGDVDHPACAARHHAGDNPVGQAAGVDDQGHQEVALTAPGDSRETLGDRKAGVVDQQVDVEAAGFDG